MKTNLKDNIWIDGFYDAEDPDDVWGGHMWWDNYRGLTNYVLLYSGKTSEIPEELARECVETPLMGEFIDYSKHNNECPAYIALSTAKESILSACQEKYCLIYKI